MLLNSKRKEGGAKPFERICKPLQDIVTKILFD